MAGQSSFRWLPYTVIALWLFWLLGVLGHGWGWTAFTFKRDLVAAGQFGDAFGSLSSFMSALAATGAFLALRDQREAGVETAKLTQRQSFEGTLFHLLDVLRQKTQDIVLPTQIFVEDNVDGDGHFETAELKGPDAFEKFLETLYDNVKIRKRKLSEVYLKDARDQEANFSHYFRLVYHIIVFIHDSKVVDTLDDKYKYVRFLRAQISAPEMITILLNCLYGPGHEKFLMLASDYDFFQHVRDSNHPIAKRVASAIPLPSPRVKALQLALKGRRVDDNDAPSAEGAERMGLRDRLMRYDAFSRKNGYY